MSTAGDIELVAEVHCDWETDRAYGEVQEILRGNPGLQAIYCENDLMGLGALRAVEEAGRKGEIQIYSYDGIVAGLERVLQGDFVTTCAQQPIEMGYFGVENMLRILRGDSPEPYIDTGCRLVTQENAGKLLEVIRPYTKK